MAQRSVKSALGSWRYAKGRFGKQDFVYLAADDVYLCPAGERLIYHFTNQEKETDLAPLLDHCLPSLRYQGSMHHGQGAPD